MLKMVFTVFEHNLISRIPQCGSEFTIITRKAYLCEVLWKFAMRFSRIPCRSAGRCLNLRNSVTLESALLPVSTTLLSTDLYKRSTVSVI